MNLNILLQSLSLQEHFSISHWRPISQLILSIQFLNFKQFLIDKLGYLLSSTMFHTSLSSKDGRLYLAVSWSGTWTYLNNHKQLCYCNLFVFGIFYLPEFHSSIIRHGGTLLPKIKHLVTINCWILAIMSYFNGIWTEKSLAWSISRARVNFWYLL